MQQSLDPSRMQPGKLTRGLLGALRTTRGKLRISAPAVKTALPLAMDKLSMQAAWQDAKLQLEHSQRLAGEALTATGRGRFSGNAFHLQMSGHLQNLTTASLAALPLPAGLTGASGRLDGTLSLVIPTATGLVKSTTATLDASELGITLTHEGLPDPLALKTLTGTIGSAEPLTLKASGVLGESPLTTEVSITRWSDLVERHASPFALQLTLGKTSLGLRGEAALGQSPTLAGRLTAHLPQSGAHQPDIDLAGQLSHQGQDWQLALDTIRAGLSEGNGTLRLATGGKTATVDADLRMGVLYLADFGVTLMPPETQPPAAAVDALPAKAPLVAAPSVVEAETWLRPLRALFRKLDGRLNLVIDRWHLHDMQGPARLQANLQDSRLELALTDLQGSRGIQDGTASGTLVVNLSHPREVDLALGLRVSNGHYHLAREVAGEVSGTLDLDLALATRGVPGEGALARALNGQLRFMAVPDRGEFLLLDYWGGGLLQALAQSVGAMESSRINCAAGRMTIVNGRLTALPLILDGTRVRVNASLEVGFPGGTLIALNASSGAEIWRNDKEIFGTQLAVSEAHSTLLMNYEAVRHNFFALPSETGGRLAGFDLETGKVRWDKKAEYQTRPLINDYTIYAQGGGWNLITGESVPFELERSYGCGQISASTHLMLFRSATLGFRDLSSDKGTENWGGIRPSCWINAIPANGLVLVPDGSSKCVCSYQMRTWFALQPEG